MKINPRASMDLIRAIISCDEIADKFMPHDEGFSPFSIHATTKKEFATFEIDSFPVGVLVLDNVCDGVASIHPYLLDGAKPFYRDMWHSLVNFLTWYRPDLEHLSVSIQSCHSRLIKLCRYFGFIQFYKDFNHGVKYGNSVDRIHMINSSWRTI